MKPEAFFDNFEVLAEAPNGVKKLREMILQLAVRGKLVAQDERDEPASVLLEKIRAEKERLVKDKKITKAKALPKIHDDKIPYNLPEGWKWSRLGDICHDWGQKKPDVEFTYIDVSAIDKESGVLSDNIKILKPNEAPSRARKIVYKGTVIYATVRPYLLNIAIVDKEIKPEPIVSTAFAVLCPLSGVLNRYLYYYLRSKPFIAYVEAEMIGMAYPAINDGKLYLGLVPLPPLNEQHRIVAKVDQLMSLCDELEARQQKKRESRARINSAALDRLLAARAPGEFAQGWRRISDNFDLLYDAPENVVALRKAILQLAVMGKLVAQDERDEPASVLLEKIKAEKDKQIKEKKFKKNKPMPSIEIDGWHELPKGWLWSRIGEVFLTSSGSTPNRSKLDYFINGTENWVKTTDLNNGTVLSCEEKITIQAVEDCNLKYYPIGTVCIAMYGGGGTIGKSGILGIETTINQSVFGIYPNKHINPEFLHFYMKSIRAKWMMFAAGLRRDPNINGGIIDRMIFPLPPLNEQNRIVSKLSDLMSLCDELEAGLMRSQADSEKLVEAVVGKMLAWEDSMKEKNLNQHIPPLQ